MITNNRMLIDETPLTFQPTLAKTIGLNGAIFLQQLHFWLKIAEQRRNPQNYFEGRWWMQASYTEWAEQYFPFWSAEMIKRIVFYLEREQRIIIGRADSSSSKGKWYAIDYAELERLDILPPEANAEHAVELEPEKEKITSRAKTSAAAGNSARRLPSPGNDSPDPGQNDPGQNDPGQNEPYPLVKMTRVVCAKSPSPLKELKDLKRDSKETGDSGRALESSPATPPLIPPIRRTGLVTLTLPAQETPMSNLFAADQETWLARIRAGRPDRKQEATCSSK